MLYLSRLWYLMAAHRLGCFLQPQYPRNYLWNHLPPLQLYLFQIPVNHRVANLNASVSQVDDASSTGVLSVAQSSSLLLKWAAKFIKAPCTNRQHPTWWEYIGWTSTLKATNVAADVQC